MQMDDAVSTFDLRPSMYEAINRVQFCRKRVRDEGATLPGAKPLLVRQDLRVLAAA